MKTRNNLNLNTDHLLILAQHLVCGEMHNVPYSIESAPLFIPHENGDFECIEPYFEYILNELPHVFPEDWIETTQGEILCVLDTHQTLETSLKGWFGINKEMFFHLFFPGRQNIERFSGKILNNNSSHLEIAMNIIELVCKSKEKSLIPPDTIFLN